MHCLSAAPTLYSPQIILFFFPILCQSASCRFFQSDPSFSPERTKETFNISLCVLPIILLLFGVKMNIDQCLNLYSHLFTAEVCSTTGMILPSFQPPLFFRVYPVVPQFYLVHLVIWQSLSSFQVGNILRSWHS